jgi:hypothetical protein
LRSYERFVMIDWFEKLIKDIIWQAIRDAIGKVGDLLEAEVEEALRKLVVGEKLNDSPLIKVLAVDEAQNSVTLFLRGRIPLFPGATSAFMRIELVLSRDVNLAGNADKILTIKRWVTVIGDLQFGDEKVFDAHVTVGYDRGSYSGRGALQLKPPTGFALDLFLGGLDKRGAMLGIDVQTSVAIPLGPTGLGLIAIGGDYARNFKPRIEKDGVEISSPTADHYVMWARDAERADRWVAGPLDRSATGLGVRVGLCTIFDNGWVIMLKPVGVGVFSLGPTFVLGGRGVLLNMKKAQVGGTFAVDTASGSISLGMDADIELKVTDFIGFLELGTLLKAHGIIDSLFSFKDPTLWYINMGTELDPIKVEVLEDVPIINLTFSQSAEGFFQINNERVLFGAQASMGGELELLGIFAIIARIAFKVVAFIGWNPFLIKGRVEFLGEVGVRIWKFKFLFTGQANVSAYLPSPLMIRAEFKIKIDLPWPIPDPDEVKLPIAIGEEELVPPTLLSPLLAGRAVAGGEETLGTLRIGSMHTISARHWTLPHEQPWPDLELVVPFSRRVTDTTNTVVGPAVTPELQGGYLVSHQMRRLELFDLVGNTPVAGINGVWVDGPDGDSARLHLLGRDPFSWLLPSVKNYQFAFTSQPVVVEQNFGFGPNETFSDPRQFGVLVIGPRQAGDSLALTSVFQPDLPTRVLQFSGLILEFRTSNGHPLNVDRITVYLVRSSARLGLWVDGDIHSYGLPIQLLPGGLELSAFNITLPAPSSRVEIAGPMNASLGLYRVVYREARTYSTLDLTKTVLKPGRYRLTIEGISEAKHETDPEYKDEAFPAATPVHWSVVQEFGVRYPETLRPYILHSTLGDNRLFDSEIATWNPTPYGVGFPIYYRYVGLVRFRAPYISVMFPNLRLRLRNEEGATPVEVVVDTAPAANPAGESALSQAGQNWVKVGGGSVPPDEEVLFNRAFPAAGKGSLSLSFLHSDGRELLLDEWNLNISRYGSFSQHLAWPGRSITNFYNTSGRYTRPSCPIPGYFFGGVEELRDRPFVMQAKAAQPGSGAMRTLSHQPDHAATPFDMASAAGAFAADIGDLVSKPDKNELVTTPSDWVLPLKLNQHLQPPAPPGPNRFESQVGKRYGRFLEATGISLQDLTVVGGIMLEQSSNTTVEALVDRQGRPYALWLRTPEPVDWRRVAVSLRIRHVEQTGECASKLNNRTPLDLEVSILPAPDASSALLVGYRAEQPTLLPRGQYELTLAFHPTLSGLPPLRPGPNVITVPEVVRLVFMQPSGQDWPTPKSKVTVPHWLLDGLVTELALPDLIGPVVRGEIGPDEFRLLLREVANRWRINSGLAAARPAAPMPPALSPVSQNLEMAAEPEPAEFSSGVAPFDAEPATAAIAAVEESQVDEPVALVGPEELPKAEVEPEEPSLDSESDQEELSTETGGGQ